jgi:hypothetical protein
LLPAKEWVDKLKRAKQGGIVMNEQNKADEGRLRLDSLEGKSLSELRTEALKGEKCGARKLTFREQCGAFAALYDGVRNKVVARAFGISIQCASTISGCLQNDPDPYQIEIDPKTDVATGRKVLMDHNRNRSPSRIRHYETVGREFEALGREEFNRRYYTEDVLKRIILAKQQLRAEARDA